VSLDRAERAIHSFIVFFHPGHLCHCIARVRTGSCFFTAFATESFKGFWVLSLFYIRTNTQGAAHLYIYRDRDLGRDWAA
jgi:hypothetical protein